MKRFGFTLTVTVEAKNVESAQNKLSDWLEPSLALKKNQNIELRGAEAVEKNLNVARGETGEEWDEDWDNVTFEDLGEDVDDDFEDEEDEGDEEVAPAPSIQSSDEYGLTALKSLSETLSPEEDEDDEEDEDTWGLTW